MKPAPRLMEDPDELMRFVLAGDARLTVKSVRTGQHRTYRVRAPSHSFPSDVRFVSCLADASTWAYVGSIFRPSPTASWGDLTHTKKSRYRQDTASFMAFDWLWRHLSRGKMPPETEVWHEGACGRCGRALTHPDSLDSGIGPECAAQMGLVRSKAKVLRTAADVDEIMRRG